MFVGSADGDGNLVARPISLRDLGPKFESRLISVIGLRLGDEGKGRTIPELCRILRIETGLERPVAFVGKVNGGANSGHSVEIEFEGQKVMLGLNLIPTGIADKDVGQVGLGGGVLADPFKLSWEAGLLESYELNVAERLLIDENTMVVDISHRIRDIAREESRREPRGSTGRGISPGYEDEADFSAIRWSIFKTGNFAEFSRLMRERLELCCERAQHECHMSPERWSSIFDELSAKEKKANASALARGVCAESDFDLTRYRGEKPFTFDVDRLINDYWNEGRKRVAQIIDIGERIQQIIDTGREFVVFESGQALGLDKRNGLSRSRTASHTGTAEVFNSFRVRPSERIVIIGAAKAYETAVGNHDFPTRMDPDQGDDVALAGKLRPKEKGVTTGRQREVGHFDAVQVAASLRSHGCDFLVINKIDELSYSGDWKDGKVRICIGYVKPDGEPIQYVPREASDRVNLKPIYLDMPGWDADLTKTRSFSEWPIETQRFFATLVVAPVKIAGRGLHRPPTPPRVLFAGVGPGEEQIVRNVPDHETLESLAYTVEIFGAPPPAGT